MCSLLGLAVIFSSDWRYACKKGADIRVGQSKPVPDSWVWDARRERYGPERVGCLANEL